MTYEEVVKKAKTAVKKIDTSAISEHFAIEIDIEGEGEGALYIELDQGKAVAEPYDYHDNDCRIRTDAGTFIELLKGKIDAATALSEGRIFFAGNWEKAVSLAHSLKPATAQKKAATTKKASATAKTATAKKTTATKATATKKTAATKKTEEKKPAAKKVTVKKA